MSRQVKDNFGPQDHISQLSAGPFVIQRAAGLGSVSACCGSWRKEDSNRAVATWKRLMGLHVVPEPCEARSELFGEGDRANRVWLIADGLVLLFRPLPDGEEAVLGLRFPGQFVDYCSLSLGAPHHYSARTVSFCHLYCLDATGFRNREAGDPEFARFIQRLVYVDLRSLIDCQLELKTQALEDRFCHFLTFLATALGIDAKEQELHICVPLRDEELAGLLGASTRQFKRVKRRLQERGTLRTSRPHELTLALRSGIRCSETV